MPQDSFKRDLEDFRALQEEMLRLSQEYSQARLAAWTEEVRSLNDSWAAFSREWQGSLEEMSALATAKFQDISAQGEAAGSFLTQSWQRTLTDLSAAVDGWGEHFLAVLAQVAAAWGETLGGVPGQEGEGWSAWLGLGLGLGGWFHQGGIVAAHQGLVLAPGTLLEDEQLVLAQAGEGILPRESMTRLGEKNFEALRSGQFEVAPGEGPRRFEVNIQVQSLDAAGVAALDWDRVVQRHLLPALQRETSRRW
jgi:hypothetical protein